MDKKQVNRDIFRMVLPIVIENVLQMLAGLVTTAMIGRLLADDIAAQGIGNRINNTFWALFKGVGIGATVIVAMRYGQQKFHMCRRTVEQVYSHRPAVGLLLRGLYPFVPRKGHRPVYQRPRSGGDGPGLYAHRHLCRALHGPLPASTPRPTTATATPRPPCTSPF